VGPGPRRVRAYRRAQRLLNEGAWEPALALAESLRSNPNLSKLWKQRLDKLAGEGHEQAAADAIKGRRYEDALEHALASAPLLQLGEAEQRTRVLEAMLAEVRRLFAAGTGAEDT